MSSTRIVVQKCGCIALPEELASTFGMLPGAVLQLKVDTPGKSVTLQVAEAAPNGVSGALAACASER